MGSYRIISESLGFGCVYRYRCGELRRSGLGPRHSSASGFVSWRLLEARRLWSNWTFGFWWARLPSAWTVRFGVDLGPWEWIWERAEVSSDERM